jgi:hypothetical protein
MAQTRKPIILDEMVRRIAEGMLSIPPSPLGETKVAKTRPKTRPGKSKSAARRSAGKGRGSSGKSKRTR